ncbi:M28 family metallopeptidase [Salsipaludibacter albus]|uniref:M28 family metallopeptidase n=1 Tax=Salsipaludibacter albus TaxID=2849650 RepID=UPI001EE47152|nr:M28 family metallopeptidase [Salsipaludibacter albus]MBY5161920.1 M28 family peptidase [Salsipaludibacter albus]
MRTTPRTIGVAAAAAAVVAAGMLPVAADPNNNNSRKLTEAVTVDGILEHEQALQDIADANGNNRLAGAPGYEDTVDYVAARAEAAGLDVTIQEFDYTLDFLADWQAPVLAVEGGAEFVGGIAGGQLGGDFGSMYNTGAYGVDVTAPVWAADLADGGPTTSGCQAADFAGMPAGAIAVIQVDLILNPVGCFPTNIFNAFGAGAAAIVVIPTGQAGDTGPVWINFSGTTLPAMAASFETGLELTGGVLQGDTGQTARFFIDWRPGTYTTRNVIAQTPEGDPDNVVVVGAHLDSVGVGPGINDNGSGSSTILEIAEQMSKVKPRNAVRFAWFSAEESGLLGSEAYVDSLSADELDQIAAMLNFDMVGSPNFARFVYDGDLSDSEPPPSGAPDGSAQIEDLFVDWFDSQGLASEPTAFSGRSDYGPFIEVGIPAGGLFTGAEGIKTEEQVALYGGTAGEQYDPCYHLSCDDMDNLSLTALDQMGDAAAHATISLAQSTEIVNGVRGKGNFSPKTTGPPIPEPVALLGD